MSGRIFFQAIDHTGEVVGEFAAPPCGVTLNGWALSNSAAAVGSAAFYGPAAVTGGAPQVLPSAAGTLLFTIQVAANASKEFFVDEEGVYFKDGLFVVMSASTMTGGVFFK